MVPGVDVSMPEIADARAPMRPVEARTAAPSGAGYLAIRTELPAPHAIQIRSVDSVMSAMHCSVPAKNTFPAVESTVCVEASAKLVGEKLLSFSTGPVAR